MVGGAHYSSHELPFWLVHPRNFWYRVGITWCLLDSFVPFISVLDGSDLGERMVGWEEESVSIRTIQHTFGRPGWAAQAPHGHGHVVSTQYPKISRFTHVMEYPHFIRSCLFPPFRLRLAWLSSKNFCFSVIFVCNSRRFVYKSR